jgi:hypothetical protein
MATVSNPMSAAVKLVGTLQRIAVLVMQHILERIVLLALLIMRKYALVMEYVMELEQIQEQVLVHAPKVGLITLKMEQSVLYVKKFTAQLENVILLFVHNIAFMVIVLHQTLALVRRVGPATVVIPHRVRI